MKLFLHWLRWDLHRFRILLRVWTYLLLSYTVILGWAHLNIFKIQESTVFLTWKLGGMMWGIGVFLLMFLLTADPLSGSRAFWKTRPPTGYAVAAGKLTLALVFFVGLPLVLLILMFACVWPSGFLIAMGLPKLVIVTGAVQIMTLSVILLATAVSGSPFQLGMKLIFWTALLALIWFIIQGLRSPREGWIPWIERVAWGIEKAERPLIYLISIGVGAGVYVFAKRSRTPCWLLGPIAMLSPLVLFGTIWMILLKPDLAKLEHQEAQKIRVDRLSLRTGNPFGGRLESAMNEIANAETRTFTLWVKFSDLPPEATVFYGPRFDSGVFSPRWSRLSLISPDGRTISALPDSGQNVYPKQSPYPKPSRLKDFIKVAPVEFVSKDLAPFSLAGCSLKGTLRVVLVKPGRVAVFNLEDGLVHATPLGLVQITSQPEITIPGEGVGGRFATNQIWRAGRPDEIESVFLEHRITKERFSVGHARGRGLSAISVPDIAGLLPGTVKETGAFVVTSRASEPMISGADQALRREDLSGEWELHVAKRGPWAIAEIEVEFDLILVPRQKGDLREVAPLISGIHPSTDTTPTERQRLIQYALLLANLAGEPGYSASVTRDSPDSFESNARLSALETFLRSIRKEELGDLLAAVESDLPGTAEENMLSDGPVKQRIMELLNPENLPKLTEHLDLIDYLKDELVRQKRIPATGGRPLDHCIPLMSNDTLMSTWQMDQKQPELSVESLKEALRRGLAWSMPAAVQIIELMLNAKPGTDLLNFLPEVSECPSGRIEALKWFRKHAAHLVWDEALGKWLISPGANSPAK